MSNKKWYAVYTRPGWEKKVSEYLSRKSIENYCPLNKVQKQWSDKRNFTKEPLFTSFVFVHVAENEKFSLIKMEGVVNLIYWLGMPAVIRDEEIQLIRRFLTDYENVKLEKMAVNTQDRVRIVSSPLMEYEGHMIAVKNTSLKITLPSLGYMMSAEVEMGKVEIIREKLHSYTDIDNLALS